MWGLEDLAQLSPAADSLARFREKFTETAGISGKLTFMTSGRQALRYLLSTLSPSRGRTDVLLSAFNCPVVPEAVRAAGYRPVFYDFSSACGNVDWNNVARRIDTRVAAVIVSHFFGAPADAEAIRQAARMAGVCVIEDCAHTVGASVQGAPVGSIWDAAVFSFNYGKPISLCGGAALVLNSEAMKELSAPVHCVDEATERREIEMYMEAVAAGRRAIRPVPAPLELMQRVFRRLGFMTRLTPRLARGLGPVRAALGLISLSRWNRIQAIRNANAEFIFAQGIPSWYLPPAALPSWLRLRSTLRDKQALIDASYRLSARGLRAGNINWPGIERRASHMPWASQAASYGIDVPIHQNLTADDLAFVADVLAPLVMQPR
jgi:dTDP-4-amino-4,6-dideoxygalactose transaminase